MPPSAADLDRLTQAGWPRHDPLRWRFIEALAARAADADGALRARLEARVGALLAQYQAAMPAAGPDAPASARAGDAPTVSPRPLAALLAHVAAHASPTAELRTLQRFRQTWSRLAADRQVLRSRMRLPDNAGPLNSQRLVHRALMLMHELSPAYLERFVAHADALLWLDRASGADLPAPKDAPAQPAGGATRARARPKGRGTR